MGQWFRGRCRLKEKFTDDEQRPITIAHREPSAQVSLTQLTSAPIPGV